MRAERETCSCLRPYLILEMGLRLLLISQPKSIMCLPYQEAYKSRIQLYNEG